MKWIAMFSQTGSEIVNISKRLGCAPDMIITNNIESASWHPELMELTSTYMRGPNKALMEYLRTCPPAFITLHGYLRILPLEVVERHEVVNGHPGDIVKYPELKGKDPQQKAIDLGLPSTGVVLHKAIAEVDAGQIISREVYYPYKGITTNQLISELKDIQLDLWCNYLDKRVDKCVLGFPELSQ